MLCVCHNDPNHILHMYIDPHTYSTVLHAPNRSTIQTIVQCYTNQSTIWTIVMFVLNNMCLIVHVLLCVTMVTLVAYVVVLCVSIHFLWVMFELFDICLLDKIMYYTCTCLSYYTCTYYTCTCTCIIKCIIIINFNTVYCINCSLST